MISTKEKGLGKKVLNVAKEVGGFLPIANYHNFRKEIRSKHFNVKRSLARVAIASTYALGGIALVKHHKDNYLEELKNSHQVHQTDSAYVQPNLETDYIFDTRFSNL